jgi:SH3-like domain-containing protein
MVGGGIMGRLAAFAILAAAGAYVALQFTGGGNAPDAPPPGSAQAAKSAGAIAVGAVSNLPLPRFVSLKSNEVNVRRGAGTEHQVMWTYHHAGLPVEIIQEWNNWRRIRDADGADGWIFHSLLSGRRTALVAPWSKEPTLPLLSSADEEAAVVARLQPNVLANVDSCAGDWCRVSGEGFDGWMKQDQLFGVYPGERFD